MENYNSEVPGNFEKAAYALQMEANDEVDKHESQQQLETNISSSVDHSFDAPSVMNIPFEPSIMPDTIQSLSNINQEVTSNNPQLNVESEIEQLHSAISDSVSSIVNTNENENVDKMDWTNIADEGISSTEHTSFLDNIRQENINQNLLGDNFGHNSAAADNATPMNNESIISQNEDFNLSKQTNECSSVSNLTTENVETEMDCEKNILDEVKTGSQSPSSFTDDTRMDISNTDANTLTNNISEDSFKEFVITKSQGNEAEPDETINQPDTILSQSDGIISQSDVVSQKEVPDKSLSPQECIAKEDVTINQDETEDQEDVTVSQQDVTVAQQDERVNQQDEIVSRQDETVSQQDETISQQDETVSQQGETVNQQDETLSQQCETVSQQDEIVNQQGETVRPQDETINQESETVNQESETVNQESEIVNQESETVKQQSETVNQQSETANQQNESQVQEISLMEDLDDQMNQSSNEATEIEEIDDQFSENTGKMSDSSSVHQITTATEETVGTSEQILTDSSKDNTELSNTDKGQESNSVLSTIIEIQPETEIEPIEHNQQEKSNKSQNKSKTNNTLQNSVLGTSFETNENVEGADAELTIIPDTHREISQAEKDAASSIPPLRDISESNSTTQTSASEDSIASDQTGETEILIYVYEKEDMQKCDECKLQRKVDYYYSSHGKSNYLCDENCLNSFKRRQNEKVVLNWDEGSLRVKNFTGSKEPPSLSFIRKCAACKKITDDIDNNLTWEIMDFCNDACLTKYQKEIGSYCSSCQGEVKSNSLGKYCVRFGNDIRQFCTSICLEKYKKGLKVCSYCQQDMSGGPKGFLAPVGDKGQFKDFCSQLCMDKYDIMTNDRPPAVPAGTKCSVCNAEKPITIEFELDGAPNHFCGEPCFVAFSFVNNISPGKCAMCRRHFSKSTLERYTMYYDNVQYSFCSNSCENIYIIAHRKIVPCSWCKVKKYNFDMIRRYSKDGSVINMCSVNCLSLFRVSINAVNSRQTLCNYCQKVTHPMYHLTMSDATVRNFCSYSCVMTFQGQFPKQPITLNDISESYPVPAGAPRKNKRFTGIDSATTMGDIGQLPIIANVQSLATNGNLASSKSIPPSLTPITTRTTRSKSAVTGPQVMNSTPTINSFSDLPFQVQIKQHFIVRPAPIPEQKNVATMCYTRKSNKSVTAKVEMVDQEIQTDEREASKILIPVPVPIFVPTPMHMFSAPSPVPVPFPVPIPIPVFIPTTRNSAAGIMKEIKKIQVKIPTDPYEAEILMMAEMVAEEKKEETTDSESDVDDTGGPEDSYSPEPVDASNTFGDDMLQMALKMATELDEPAVDLEGALTANTITAPQGSEPHSEEAVDDPQPLHQHMLERSPSVRGRKRGMRQSRGGAKRGRRMSHHQVDMPMMQAQMPQPSTQAEPQEKPDANMCLKYTFGVNAWKQWVTTKNAELEKSSRGVKLFKTEILQLTSDELNYSLCLFVKEVRKPNGAEYAPDTIYYLCLGIQQYLSENGRIDNIFCDMYYEKFTDCLDEVAKKFSVLYNDSHYIVTRVEEEHLWESKQLGAHSPHVLLSTLMFFNTKHFNLTSVDEHMQLSFSHIMKHWKRNPNQPGASKAPGSRNVLLRFYPPQSAIQNNARKKKVYEQQENEENPLRCPVKLYEFYISKCPESVKTRNDVFYLQPERSCVPDSPVWYSAMPLPREALEKMLHRVKMVKEINVALLTS